MESDLGAVASFFIVLALTGIHAFFALSETALVRSQSLILRRPEYVGRFGNRSALKLIQNPAEVLLLLQLGILISVTLFGLFLFTMPLAASLRESISERWSMGQVGVVLFGLFLQILFGALIPRSISFSAPERNLMLVAPTLHFLTRITRPILFLLITIGRLLLKPFRPNLPQSLEFSHTSADISRIFEVNGESDEIDEGEKEMIQGVFEFSHTVAREVMTPRTDLITLPIHASIEEIVQTVTSSGHSRFPVRGESIDDIRGILLAKDLLPILTNERKRSEFALSRVMRKAYFIPDTKPIDDLLNELKRRKIHMAIVLDEHGGVDGLVTLEDLIEEIVGDIFDESDTPEEDFEVEPSGDVLVDGGMLVFELNEHFTLGIPEGEYDTIAGFIFTSLGRMPHVGDRVEVRNFDGESIVSAVSAKLLADSGGPDDSVESARVSIIVEEIENNRISLVRIKLAELSETTETARNRAAS
jgi:putative hemolysin